jgi:hypothetical protein
MSTHCQPIRLRCKSPLPLIIYFFFDEDAFVLPELERVDEDPERLFEELF